jgi:putative peptidoglycan lipid II flippase
MVTNMFLNLLFVGILLSLQFRGPHMGLALASTSAAYLNAAMLFHGLRKQGVYHPEHGWGRVLFAVVVACILMLVALLWQIGSLDQWLMAPVADRARRLAVHVVGGTLLYLAVLFLAGLRKHHLEKGAV